MMWNRLEVSPHHEFDELVWRDLIILEFTRILAITQDDGTVGKILYLIKPVRDVEDADTLFLQRSNDIIKSSCFGLCQAARWLIHDEQA